MKLLGSIKELVKLVFRTSGGKEVEVQPAEQTAAGPVTIEIPDVGAGGSDTVVMEATSATLSNKTIDNSNDIDAEAIADGSVTNEKFQHLGGVTSDIQTQIDGKEDTITLLPVSKGGTNSDTPLGNDKVMVSESDAIVESTVTTTELGHLSGVSSNIQTQFSNKANAGANSDITSLSGLTTALSVAQGGTGETTANDALNALLPSQSGNLNKFLRTDGTDVEWAPAGGGSGINYMSEFFDSDVSPVTTSVAAISTTNTDYTNFLVSSAGGTLSQDTASSIRGANSYKFVPTASGEFFGFPAFQLASVDLGKALSIKFDLKNDGAAADYDVVVCRYNSSGVHQETISVAGTASAGTPASAQLPTSLTSFRGFFVTGSSSTDYYRLFVRHLTSATDAVYLDTLVIGPDAVMEGAIVTEWENYTPVITGSTTDPTYNTSGFNAHWRRVGDSLEVDAFFNQGASAGTAGSGAYYISLPSGLTIDTTKTSTGSSTNMCGTALFSIGTGTIRDGLISTVGPNKVGALFHNDTAPLSAWTNAGAYNFGVANIRFSFRFIVPIAEWSANTVMANRAVEEYAATSGTWDANSSTTVYGPAGVQMGGALTTNREKTITFQSPILSTDKMFVEISQDGVVWYDANGFLDTSGNPVINSYSSAGTGSTSSGVFLRKITGSSNQVGVFFFRYAALANDDSPVINWQSTWYWRVRKVSSGAAVGFPVSARNVIGDTSGTAVPAGYVGQTSSTTFSSTASTSGASMGSLSVPAGVWMLVAQAQFYGTGNSNDFATFAFNTSSGSMAGTRGLDLADSVIFRASGVGTLTTITKLVNITSSTTYHLNATTSTTASGSPGIVGSIQAIRIA